MMQELGKLTPRSGSRKYFWFDFGYADQSVEPVIDLGDRLDFPFFEVPLPS